MNAKILAWSLPHMLPFWKGVTCLGSYSPPLIVFVPQGLAGSNSIKWLSFPALEQGVGKQVPPQRIQPRPPGTLVGHPHPSGAKGIPSFLSCELQWFCPWEIFKSPKRPASQRSLPLAISTQDDDESSRARVILPV